MLTKKIALNELRTLVKDIIKEEIEQKFKNWKHIDSDYWLNQETNWVVKDIGRDNEERWVIVDDRGMMISCEWKDNKEDCMEEADNICLGNVV